MHVALIGAEFEENLAVRYLWGALRARGHEVTQVVFNEPEELEEAARRLAVSQAPLAGMSLVFTRRASEFATLATRARELGYGGHITVGGHFAAFNAEALLRDVPAIDSVVIGEGEEILCRLAAAPDDPSSVHGLVWRAHDGALIRNPPSPKPGDLDTLPWPMRKLPYDDYLGMPIVNMLGSRGCAHHCNFCSIAAWHRMCGGARLRLRSPERVAEEMGELFRDGVRVFNFHDDNFIISNRRLMFERVERLKRGLEAHGVGRIAFAIKARPDEVERELFERLMELGLFRVFLGVEAGSAESLLRLGRGQLLEDNLRALAVTRELGLHACFNLLMWNPESTLEDVAVNVEFLRTHPHNPMNFCRTEIYAGTPLEISLRESDRLIGDYWGYDYRMTDPRAQRSFEVAYAAFEERNFGETSLHHWAMQLDYEYHLLAHFFGEDAPLRRRVEGFVEMVNVDTAERLQGILRAVAEGTADAAFTARVVEEVARRDEDLDDLAREILLALRQAAVTTSVGVGPWAQRAAAAGLVAALTLGGPACSGDDGDSTHPTEMVPVPIEPAGGAPPVEMRPLPPEQPAEAPKPPDVPEQGPRLGEPAAIRAQFDRFALQHVARRVQPPRETSVTLVVGEDGHVTEVTVRARGLASARQAEIEASLRRIRFSGADVLGRRFELTLSRRAIRDAAVVQRPHPSERAPRPFTHPTEMAPPPTQIFEEAPMPPGKGGGDEGSR